MIRNVLIAAMCLGVAIDGFFAVINFYPVAPHASRGRKRYVVMRLDDDQAAWFRSNVLADFNAEANTDVQLIAVDDEEELQATAADAAKHGKDVVLVDLPTTQLPSAISAVVQSFAGAVGAERIAADLSKLGEKVLAPGKVGGAQYFLPDMTRVDVAVYRASKVRDAVLHWSALRPQIDAALKKVNGRGLPAGYELDLSPEDWDSYDLFVLGYYWANRVYSGQPAQPRIAHRTGEEIDGQLDIAAGLYRAGVDRRDVREDRLAAGDDYFEWETCSCTARTSIPRRWPPRAVRRRSHGRRAHQGDLYFATIDSMEAFDIARRRLRRRDRADRRPRRSRVHVAATRRVARARREGPSRRATSPELLVPRGLGVGAAGERARRATRLRARSVPVAPGDPCAPVRGARHAAAASPRSLPSACRGSGSNG